MSWASRRRALILSIVAAIVVVGGGMLAYSVLHKTPTCFDHKKDQDELGIDCGGSCTTLCSAQVATKPTARFVRVLQPQPGRSDIVAYIDNPNGNAQAKSAQFTLELFAAGGGYLAKKTITVDLPPSSTVPVYLADVAPKGGVAVQAFLTNIASSTVWTKPGAKLPLPTATNILPQEGNQPRVTATLVNPIAYTQYDTTLVATVFDEAGNVMAASQTVVPTLPPQGTAPITFTWNAPFAAPVARVEILPVPRLPSR